MAALADGGLPIDLPSGWDGQIRRWADAAGPSLRAADGGAAAPRPSCSTPPPSRCRPSAATTGPAPSR